MQPEEQRSMTTTITYPIQHHHRLKKRLFAVHNGVLAAILAWVVEVHVLGISLTTRFGSSAPRTLGLIQIIGVAAFATLTGWVLLSLMERRVTRAGVRWTVIATGVTLVSLALPVFAATSQSATIALIVMHLAVGASYIPFMNCSSLTAGESLR
jgi:hypothetical protein